MTNHTVDVITVVYNAKDDLEKTILSVKEQSYPFLSHIVVDGKSEDGTFDVIKRHSGDIHLWLSEKDEGIYDAMNKGIDLTSSEWIIFLNAGDVFCDADVVKKSFDDIGESTNLVYGDHVAISPHKKTYKKAKEFTLSNLLRYGTSVACHQSIFIKKSVAPYYNSTYLLKGELDWYFEFVEGITYKKVEFPVCYYMLGGTGDVNFTKNVEEYFMLIWRRFGIIGIIKASRQIMKCYLKIIIRKII